MARAAVASVASDTPERILKAALEAFAEQGFDGARTRDIASRAGVTLGLLQYHFGNKSALWKAAVARAFEELNSGLDAVLGAPGLGDERERLRALIRSHVRFVAQKPEFVRLMHDEGKRRGPRARWLADKHVKPLYEKFSRLIEAAQATGVLPSGIAPVHFMYILVGAIDVIFHQAEECKRIAGIDPADEKAVAAHTRAVEELFLS